MNLYKILQDHVSTSSDIVKLIYSYLETCQYCKNKKTCVYNFYLFPHKKLCDDCWKDNYALNLFNDNITILTEHIQGVNYIIAMYGDVYFHHFYMHWISGYIKRIKKIFKQLHLINPQPFYNYIITIKLNNLKENITSSAITGELALIRSIFTIWNAYALFLT